jgi:hypothetical protein
MLALRLLKPGVVSHNSLTVKTFDHKCSFDEQLIQHLKVVGHNALAMVGL